MAHNSHHLSWMYPYYQVERAYGETVREIVDTAIKKCKFSRKDKIMPNEQTPILRAKLRVLSVTQSKNSEGGTEYEKVQLAAVYGSPGTENAEWSRWTPSASFDIQISNPNAFGKLSKGHEFYVDFTPAVSQEAPKA